MANWLNYKCCFIIIFPFLIATSYGDSKQIKWGFFGHQRINRIAVFTLPPEIFGFYKEHIEYLTEHAVDPDKRRYAVEGEAQRHYIDLDHYYQTGQDVFSIIPKKWNDAVEKYSEDTLQNYGIVPWFIPIMKSRLQKAFEDKNIDLILKYSADLGHYIADAHVPLHTTQNYNGQLTGQKGIHGLWESRLVELNAENYSYFVGKSKYISNVLNQAWEAVKESHLALDSVLKMEVKVSKTFESDKKYSFEQRGNVTIPVYSYEFSQAYHQLLNGMVERRMKEAILLVGSVWYTAWVDAGQPNMNELLHQKPSKELLDEMHSLNDEYLAGKKKGRICD